MAAGYTLLDDVSKLRILLHVKRQLILIIVAFTLVTVLILPQDPLISVPDYFPKFVSKYVVRAEMSSIGSGGAAFLVIIFWALIAVFLYKTARPNTASFKKLNLLVERLLAEARYIELVDPVNPYIKIISDASRRKLWLQTAHDWLEGGGPFALSISDWIDFRGEPNGKVQCTKRALSSWGKRKSRSFVSSMAVLVPARHEVTQTATDLEVSLLRSVGLANFLVGSRADFAISLMGFDRFSSEEFSNILIRRMMNTPDSHFFRELKLMDVRQGGGGYVYEKQLVLLKYFVLDSKFACDHRTWKPVGDEAIRIINEDTAYRNNLLKEPVDDGALYDDVVFCTIKYFEAMVDAAANAGVEDNMWLMYMSVISEQLVDVHAGSVLESPDMEFPTHAMRLIWEITNSYRGWIELYRNLKESNYHVSASNLRGWANSSVLMWSVRDYAETIRHIIASPHLPEAFKIDRWTAYVRLIVEIPDDERFSFMRKSLISEVIEPHHYSRLGNLSADISIIHNQIDTFQRFGSEDLNIALGMNP